LGSFLPCFGIDLLLFFGDQPPNWIRTRQSFVGTSGVRGFLSYTMILFIALTYTDGREKEAGGTERKFRFAYKRGERPTHDFSFYEWCFFFVCPLASYCAAAF
jgi:hypothetical protein